MLLLLLLCLGHTCDTPVTHLWHICDIFLTCSVRMRLRRIMAMKSWRLWSSRNPYKIKELQLLTVSLWKGHKPEMSDWLFLINYISLSVNLHVCFQLLVSFWCKPPKIESHCETVCTTLKYCFIPSKTKDHDHDQGCDCDVVVKMTE